MHMCIVQGKCLIVAPTGLVADCDASTPPAHGAAGDCPAALPAGSTCQPTCDEGHIVSGPTTCGCGGNLNAATCDTGVAHDHYSSVSHLGPIVASSTPLLLLYKLFRAYSHLHPLHPCNFSVSHPGLMSNEPRYFDLSTMYFGGQQIRISLSFWNHIP